MLPVTIGAGLMPGEGSSVAPRPIPTGDIGAPAVLPSGEVVPTVGVGWAIPVTCASAPPPAKKARQAATRQHLTGGLHGRRSGYTEAVDGRTHALAVLHDHRVNTGSDGGISLGSKRKDPPKRVHSSCKRAPINRLQRMLRFVSAKLASTVFVGHTKDVGSPGSRPERVRQIDDDGHRGAAHYDPPEGQEFGRVDLHMRQKRRNVNEVARLRA